MPTILIKRAGGWQDALRSYQVMLDGVVVGEVKRNAAVSLAVEPGTHKVRLKIDWLGSPEITVTLTADEVRTLSCAPAAKASPYWIDLQDLNAEREAPPPHATSGSARNSQADHKREERSSYERDREADSDSRQSNLPEAESVSTSCYEVLGIKSTATVVEIRTAYRRLQSQYHPDKVAHLGPDLITLAEAKSKEINNAYSEAMKAASDGPGNEA